MIDAFGNPRTAVVLGGGSDIAQETLRRLAARGLETAVLAVRRPEDLDLYLDLDDSALPRVEIVRWDANDIAAHEALLTASVELMGDIDLVICAVGTLGHQTCIDTEPSRVRDIISDNFTGPATALTAAARTLHAQGHGVIVVLSSVAGLRPRRSNYIYGSAKAGIDAFCRGMSDALADTDVLMHVIRPGFVVTKMTSGLKPAPFSATAGAVADAIVGTITARTDRVVFVPRVLQPLFWVLRLLPTRLWRIISRNR